MDKSMTRELLAHANNAMSSFVEVRAARIQSLQPCDSDTPQQKAQKEIDLIAIRVGGTTGGLVASGDGKSFKFCRPKPYLSEPNNDG